MTFTDFKPALVKLLINELKGEKKIVCFNRRCREDGAEIQNPNMNEKVFSEFLQSSLTRKLVIQEVKHS